MRLPFGGEIERSGTVTVPVHVHELSGKYRKAHEGRRARALGA